uniref:Uncharacterized protein n=1 Tax=Heterorhabditis bacteriophora TaxID=37862 RepID=A0A1I7WQX7_HETBA
MRWIKACAVNSFDYLKVTAPSPPIRISDEYSTFSNTRRKTISSYDPIFDKVEPIRLNLVSTGKILSEASRERDTPCSLGSINNADCPPPPAPLYCEGSIRRLQNAFQSSTSSSGSCSSLEQLPFANENCGDLCLVFCTSSVLITNLLNIYKFLKFKFKLIKAVSILKEVIAEEKNSNVKILGSVGSYAVTRRDQSDTFIKVHKSIQSLYLLYFPKISTSAEA